MINLLPENEKNQIEREYTMRRKIIILWGMLLVVAITIGFMFPSYILARYKSRLPGAAIAKTTSQASAEDQKSRQQFDTAKGLVQVLQPQTNILFFTELVPLLMKHKSEENTITSLTYQLQEDTSVTIYVRGKADTRASLSRFTEALKKEPRINTMEVPVSNFAKDVNIEYYFNMVAKPTQ